MPVDLLDGEKVISSPGNAVNIRRRRCGPRCSKGSTRPIEGSLGSCDITLPRRTASRSFLLFTPFLSVRCCALLGNTELHEDTKEPPTRAVPSLRARILGNAVSRNTMLHRPKPSLENNVLYDMRCFREPHLAPKEMTGLIGHYLPVFHHPSKEEIPAEAI